MSQQNTHPRPEKEYAYFGDLNLQKGLEKIFKKSQLLSKKELEKASEFLQLYLIIAKQGNEDKTRLALFPGRLEDVLDLTNDVDVFKFGMLQTGKGDHVSFIHVGWAMITPQMMGEASEDRFDIRIIPVVLLAHSTKMARNLGHKINLFQIIQPSDIEDKLNDWSAYLISYLLPKLQVATVQKEALLREFQEESFDMLHHAQVLAYAIVKRVLQNPEEYEGSLFDKIMELLSENWKSIVILVGLALLTYVVFRIF